MGVNKVALIGYLGADPENRKTAAGHSVTTFRIATTDTWTDREGQRQERTEWHRIVVWGKQGDNCAKYLSKGRRVYIDGRLQTRSWEDDSGNKRYTTEVIASQVMFLDGGEKSAAAGAGKRPAAAASEPQAPAYQSEPAFGGAESPSAGSSDTSMPF